MPGRASIPRLRNELREKLLVKSQGRPKRRARTSSATVTVTDWGIAAVVVFVLDGKAPDLAPIDTKGQDPEACSKHKLYYENIVVGQDNGLANVVVFVRDANVKPVTSRRNTTKTAEESVVLDNRRTAMASITHVIVVMASQPDAGGQKLRSGRPQHQGGIQPRTPVQ